MQSRERKIFLTKLSDSRLTLNDTEFEKTLLKSVLEFISEKKPKSSSNFS